MVFAGVMAGAAAAAISAQVVRQPVDAFVAAHQQAIVGELVELLSIPNVAADRDNIRRNAGLLRDLFLKRGFAVETLETGGNPLVFAELRAPGAQRTILFYAHYDGQPVEPKAWNQPSPFTPVLRSRRMEDGGEDIANFLSLKAFPPEARLYARSASDDKAPIIALLAAIDALKAANQPLTSHVKVVLDGEEEARSPGLAATIGRYRDKYRADLMLILDGPLHPTGKPTLNFGARGNLRQVRAAQRPLWKLGAESRARSGAAAGVDERRGRPRRGSGFLRRCAAAGGRRAGDSRGRARSQG